MAKFKDIAEQRFGRLTAVWPEGRTKSGSVAWLCVCDCGQLTHTSTRHLLKGDTKSCGCMRSRHGASRGGRRIPEFNSYHSAKSRCENSNTKHYENYGGRGIKFLFNSFEEFFAELGPKPSPQHSVDRWPDLNGHYEKGNVRWATQQQQSANRRPYSEWRKSR